LAMLGLQKTAEVSGSSPASFRWNFQAGDYNFDYLAAGEQVTLTYTVQVADQFGGSVLKTIPVTITGTNDGPTTYGATFVPIT
ncbi:VCBS domain-containing protein, partial [Acinetobacter baumannii]